VSPTSNRYDGCHSTTAAVWLGFVVWPPFAGAGGDWAEIVTTVNMAATPSVATERAILIFAVTAMVRA
jgi:hypothetical protein